MNPDVTGVALLVAKTLVVVGMALYVVFAGVIVRQEQLMANVLEESFEPVLRLLVRIHLVAAIGMFLLALVLL